MQNSIKYPEIILASQSPRRRFLLNQAGLSFRVAASLFDEESAPLEEPESYVETLSRAKVKDIAVKHPNSWVIGADTIVVIDGMILGKPVDLEDARRMLQCLSGHTHQVYTGYTICCLKAETTFSDVVSTDVIFKKLTPQEIDWYVQSKEPFDKAGAYAIQGLGSFLVKSIHGSYTNVVGLPVCEVMAFLIQEGVVQLNHCPDKEKHA